MARDEGKSAKSQIDKLQTVRETQQKLLNFVNQAREQLQQQLRDLQTEITTLKNGQSVKWRLTAMLQAVICQSFTKQSTVCSKNAHLFHMTVVSTNVDRFL